MSAARVAIGDTIGGRYRIEGVLGEGGMAVVYRARHLGTGRPVALKLVHPHLVAQPHLVELFIREAQVGATIGPNPNIVEVLDAAADEARGVPYLVMELLQGETLDRWCERNGPMPPALVRTIFEQLADALGQAHRAGVVHRDLKPSNLFLTADHKGQPLLKVLDFGIAKVLEGDGQRTATQIGTPSYSAPEQFGAMFRPLAERQGIVVAPGVSPATDIWAMGLIAYELLTGASSGQYWDTSTAAELPIKAVLAEHDPPSRRAGGRANLLPPGFDTWFARCLRKNAPERWPSAGHAVAELSRILPEGAPLAPGMPFGSMGQPPAPMGLQVAPFSPAPPGVATPPPYGAPPYGAPPYGAPFGPGSTQVPVPQGASGYFAGGPPVTMGGGPPYPPAQPVTQYPYGAAYPPTAWPPSAAPPPPARSSGFWIVPLILFGFILLLGGGSVAVIGVRHYRVLADAHECETKKARCDEACDGEDWASCRRLAALHEAGTASIQQDLPKAAELYERACDGNDLPACAELGRFHLTGKGGVAHDDAKGKELVTRACDGGVQRGCGLLGELVRDGDGGLQADDTRAVTLFRAACDAGVMFACKDLAAMQEQGRGGLKKDTSRAAVLYKQACDGGDPGGCNDLGVLTNRGDGTAKDPARAVALYKQACDGGEPIGCTNLGTMYEHGKGVTKDEAKAFALYTRSCDESSPGGCAALGILHEYGKAGLTKDLVKAASLYKQACDAHHAFGCYYLGTMEENGEGLAKDEPKAVEHYKIACNAGNAPGCNGLGVMTEYGKGGLTKDETKAAGIYKQACEDGALQACSNYGILLAYGRGVPKDYARAAPYFKRACDGDNPAGCSNLGYQSMRGLGLPKDAARGLELLRRGCKDGYEWGCEQLKAVGASR
jgi:TPR repeat protein/serine/threonine protein kinase